MKTEASGIQSVLGKRQYSSVKKSMEVATRGRENGSGKLKSMCIKNDAADIMINAAKKMKTDKCVSC